MATVNQILLYRNERVADSLHQIRLVNPLFTLTGATVGDWFSKDPSWSWTAGTNNAVYLWDGLHNAPLSQNFPNQLHDATYYTVCFTITGMTQGALVVSMGNDQIATITSNGSYCFSYYTSSGGTLANSISFLPQMMVFPQMWNGTIDSVSIIQDPILSPPAYVTGFEPVGFLDMYPDERFGISYLVNDVRSLNKRFGAFSTTFKLPGTGNNKALLGHLHSNEAQPKIYDPRNRTKVTLLADNLPFLRGFMSLKNITTKGDETFYEVEVFDNTFGLIDAIKGKKLSDLDLSAWQHELNRNNVVATWQDGWDWTKGYAYGLYLNFDPKFKVAEDFKPAFYNRAILDTIFRTAGYSYTLSPLLEARFNEVLTAPTAKPEINAQELERAGARVHSTTSQVFHADTDPPPIVNGYPVGVDANARWALNVEDSDPEDNFYSGSNAWFYTAPYSGKYTVEFKVKVTITGSQPTPTSGDRVIDYDSAYSDYGNTFARFDLYDADSFITKVPTTLPEWKPPYQYTTPYTYNVTFSAYTEDLDLIAGQRVAMFGRLQNRTTYFDNIAHWGTDMTMTVDDSQSYLYVRPSDGYLVTEHTQVIPADWIGDIAQADFLNDMIRAFNLYLVPDQDNERQVHIFSRSELYSTDYVIDRSGQVALDQDIVREYLSEVSSSIIELGYHEFSDKDDFNVQYRRLTGDQYGDKEFKFNTDIYNDTSEIRLTNYTPCPITRDSAGRYVPAILSKGTEKDTKLLIRSPDKYASTVLVSSYSQITASYFTTPYNFYRPLLHTDSITGATWDANFGNVDLAMTNVPIALSSNNLFESYYADQLAQYRDGRLFTVFLNLSVGDVLEHVAHIGAKIFIKELGNWFILYAIQQFDPTLGDQSLTKVQLLESPPSDRRVQKTHIYNVIKGSKDVNPIVSGEVGDQTLGQQANGTKTTIFNTNVGPNIVKGYFNTIYGSGNTVNIGANYNEIRGDNNTIAGGVTGVTIIGGASNIVANTSNTTYIGNNTVFSTTGITFWGSSGVTVGSNVTSFYGPSGVTITNSGITINGVAITSASTPTYVQPGSNISTGGTPSRPVVGVVASPSFTSVSATTFYSGSTDLSYLIGGRFAHPYRAVGSNYTIDGHADCVIGANLKASSITINLPKCADVPNWYYIVKDVSGFAATNNATISAQTGNLILNLNTGSTSVILSANGASFTFLNNGTDWLVTSKVG